MLKKKPNILQVPNFDFSCHQYYKTFPWRSEAIGIGKH